MMINMILIESILESRYNDADTWLQDSIELCILAG